MDDRQHPRPPLPLTVPPIVHCNFCAKQIVASWMHQEEGGYRFMVEHGVRSVFDEDPLDEHRRALMDYPPDDHMKICPNNGKRWVIEFQQPWIYEMDPATGEIDTFGGRVV